VNYPTFLSSRFYTPNVTDLGIPYFLLYDENNNEWGLTGASSPAPGWNGSLFGLSGTGQTPYVDAMVTYPWHVDMTVTDSDAIPFEPHPLQGPLYIPEPPVGTFSITNGGTPTIGTWSVSTSQGVC
jgi:hypothetical protein